MPGQDISQETIKRQAPYSCRLGCGAGCGKPYNQNLASSLGF